MPSISIYSRCIKGLTYIISQTENSPMGSLDELQNGGQIPFGNICSFVYNYISYISEVVERIAENSSNYHTYEYLLLEPLVMKKISIFKFTLKVVDDLDQMTHNTFEVSALKLTK